MTLQAPNIAAQAVLPKDEVSIGLAIINLFSFLGGSVFVTAGQALLEDQLVKKLRPILPNLDPSSLANGGATAVRNLASTDQLPAVLAAYNDAIRVIWYLGIGLSCLVLIAGCGFEWKSVKPAKKKDEVEISGAGSATEIEAEKKGTQPDEGSKVV